MQTAKETLAEKTAILKARMREQLREARLRALHERDDPYLTPTGWRPLYTEADDHLMPAPPLFSQEQPAADGREGEYYQQLSQEQPEELMAQESGGLMAQVEKRLPRQVSSRGDQPTSQAVLLPSRNHRGKTVSTPYIVYMLSEREISDDIAALAMSPRWASPTSSTQRTVPARH